MLVLALTLAALSATPHDPLLPCATPALGMVERPVTARYADNLPPDGEKQVINNYSELKNNVETENFVVWWGESSGFDETEVQTLADAFERSWEVEIGEMSFPEPFFATKHKVNVYIGDTGGPSSLGANGYYYYDDESWPMIVINRKLLGDPYAEVTAAHEFFHAIQDGIGSYVYAGDAAWYFEATAVWVEAKVFSDSTDYAKFVPSVAFLPELSVNHFDYPDSYDLEEYHHYGAALFVKHLDEKFGTELIRRSWVNASSPDPMTVIAPLVEEQGQGLHDVFFDYFERNTHWDYPDQEAIKASIEEAGGYTAPDSNRPSGNLRIPIETSILTNLNPPHDLGGNYWRLFDVPETFTVTIEPADEDIQWFILVSSEIDGDVFTQSHALEGDDLSATFSDHSGTDSVWLGIAAANTSGFAAQYALRLEGPASTPTRTPRSSSCGCTSGGLPSIWPIGLLLILRRKQKTSPKNQ